MKKFRLEEKVEEFFYDYDPDGPEPTAEELINWLYRQMEMAAQDAYERHYDL